MKESNSVIKTMFVVPMSVACTQSPLQNISHSFRLNESFLVDRNDHMVQIHLLGGTIDRGKVPYRLLFDTTVDIETHFS